MALERNVKREMDAISSRLEEAEEERDGLRVAVREGSSAGAELEKVKKNGEGERERLEGELRERGEVVKRLEGKVGEIEDEVERGREEVRRREERIKELEVREKKLEKEIAAASSPPPYPTTRSASTPVAAGVDQGKHDEMVSNYKSRIVELEEKLSSSLAASTTASMLRSGSDKSLHSKSEGEAEVALQRMAKELKRLRRDKQTLEDDLAASDEAVAEKDREILCESSSRLLFSLSPHPRLLPLIFSSLFRSLILQLSETTYSFPAPLLLTPLSTSTARTRRLRPSTRRSLNSNRNSPSLVQLEINFVRISRRVRLPSMISRGRFRMGLEGRSRPSPS